MSESTSEPAENRQADNRVLESKTNGQSEPTARLMLLRDVLQDVRADADAAHESRLTGKPRGAITGLANLDRELSGAFAPGLHFIHGNAGAGKTAFALQTAADCQSPAMFVTCEMAPAELLRRHTARATQTYLNRLKSGEMTGADVQRLTLQAIEKAPALAFVDATAAAANLELLHECAQIVKGDAKHLLIVIDSLHSWAGGLGLGLPEYEALNAAVGGLQRLSRRLSCAILIVSERNRDSMKSGGDGINSGAGTRKIEYGAETVISLERTKDKIDGAGEVEVTLKLAKNRHGAAGKPIDLKFNGALQRFCEV
jgi:replicative DNA helicase